MVMPAALGTHQRFSRSGVVHATNTMRAGALKLRVMTSSRSDLRSTLVRPSFTRIDLPSFPAFIVLLPAFQVFDNFVQLVEACIPELTVSLNPGGFFLEPPRTELAGPDAPDHGRGDQPRDQEDDDEQHHVGF